MKDTEILNHIRDSLRSHSDSLIPISPAQSQTMVRSIEALRGLERRLEDQLRWTHSYVDKDGATVDVLETGRPEWNNHLGFRHAPAFQHFWRCKHHPSCFENYFGRESAMMHDGEMIPSVIVQHHCEHGCDKNELRWHDNGCRPQTS